MAATPTSAVKWVPNGGEDVLQIGPAGSSNTLGGIDSTGTPYGALATASTLPATVTAAAAIVSGATNTNSLEVTTTASAAQVRAANLVATGTSFTCSSGQVAFCGVTQATVGASSGAAAVPATASAYVVVNVGGTDFVMALFAKA